MLWMGLKIKLSIRNKLIGIINLILLVAAAAIVIFATTLFSKDNIARVQEANLESARLLGSEVRGSLATLAEKMRLIASTTMQSLPPAQLEAIQRPLFEQEKDLLAQAVLNRVQGKARVIGSSPNRDQLKALDLQVEDILALQTQISEQELFQPTESIHAGQLKGSIPVITIAVPFLIDDAGVVTHVAVATIKQDRLLKAVSSDSIIQSYLVDSKGYLLAHPDQQRILKKENVTHLEVVKQLLSGKTNNGQTRYVDPTTKIKYLGAFKTVGFGGVGVISQVEEDKALEAAKKVKNSSVIITGMVAVVAFLIVFFFSLSLTRPIIRLVEATEAVAHGNYDVNLKVASRDEIGDLTAAFNTMTVGLAEREKLKGAFSKFHSKEMAEKVLSGELKLGGERRSATVFFSDVRGFTAMSENMDPEALVQVLNRYMTKMVRVIIEHGGIVDKYVGDAIMAEWGVPVAKENDVYNAVMACLGMRQGLAELNEELKKEGLMTLKIGMGLNYGPLVSGNIGSEERMEFTVIGDTVNTASRIESITKTFGTDFLISQAVLDQVQGKFIVEKAHEAKVKGKTDALIVYKVHGYYNQQGQEILIQTPYSSYAAEKSDKVESPKEEKKEAPAPQPHAPVVPAPSYANEPTLTQPRIKRAERAPLPSQNERGTPPPPDAPGHFHSLRPAPFQVSERENTITVDLTQIPVAQKEEVSDYIYAVPPSPTQTVFQPAPPPTPPAFKAPPPPAVQKAPEKAPEEPFTIEIVLEDRNSSDDNAA